jgi:hypothetical protein
MGDIFSCRDTYGPFGASKWLWYACNGSEVKHFERFDDMMNFLVSDEGKGYWPL